MINKGTEENALKLLRLQNQDPKKIIRLRRDDDYLIHLAAMRGMDSVCVEKKKKTHVVQVVEYLLDLGCEVDVRSRSDMTALNIAAKHQHASTCRLLLARGADPNDFVLKAGRWNAFHYAVAGQSLEVIKLVRAIFRLEPYHI